MVGERADFFVSHAGADRAWAEWVAWQLTDAGFTVELDVWDWAAGQNFVLSMSDALARCNRVVALLCRTYFERHRYTTEEWTAALLHQAGAARLVPVRVEDVSAAIMPPVLQPLLFADVSGMEAHQARGVHLAAVEGPRRPDGEPVFPGSGRPGVLRQMGGPSPSMPGSLPRVWNLPARNPGFTGRDGLLAAVRERLVAGDRAVVQAFQGMGGVGKTHLATEYGYRFAGAYDLSWWVDSEQPGLIGDQMAALGVALGCVEAGADVEVVRSAVLAELRARGRWLLIFDNAGTPADVRPWLPGGSGHVLITSRERGWGEIAAPVEVDVLPLPEPVAMLQDSLAGLSEADAERLAHRLGDLPLALVQAAGFMAETGMPAAEYLGLLETQASRLLDLAAPGSYPRSLAAATRLTAERLEADDPAAAELAMLCAFFGPEPIPEYLFTTAPGELPGKLTARAWDPVAWRQTLGRLARRSLARVDHRGLAMHRLTQAILRDRLSPMQAAEARERREAILAANDPRDPRNPVTWPRWAQLMPHLLAATSNPDLREMASNACCYLLARAGHDLASELWQHWRQRLGDDGEHTLAEANWLSLALLEMGRYTEARDLTRDTLDRRRRVLGDDRPDRLTSASTLVIYLRAFWRRPLASRVDGMAATSADYAWVDGQGFEAYCLTLRESQREIRLRQPLHLHVIAHRGACGKTRVVPHNRWPRPEPAEMDPGAAEVNPLTTNAFDLPDRLSAKADPALIGGDEQHFAAIAESLDQSIADLSDRIDAKRKAPGGIGQEAMDRDMEIHRLTARLRVLRRFGLDLCLGHIVGADSAERVYIGRLGLTDSAGRRLLLDWRSPAAEPFFGATHANPMGLASRRRYRWTRGRISDYWDEVFTSDGLEGHAALDDQSAFIASLGSSRSARMRDVLGTIQADQDAIIRAGSRGALVIDGGPGTGKTVVALHRSAYLLYSDPRLGQRRGSVLFVGPHQPYLAYVADVLPSLGEDGVQTATLRDLVAEGVAAAVEADPDVARIKSSAELVRAIETAVRFYEKRPPKGMTVQTHWSDIWLSAEDWAEAFDAPEPGTPHNEARDQIWEELLKILVANRDDDVPADLLRKSLLRNEELLTAFNRAWPLLWADDLVGDLWSVPAYLRMCAPWLSPEDAAKLQREDAQAWTVSDLPLLDVARQRLGDPEASRRKRRHDVAVAAEREQMARVVDDLIEVADDEYGVGLVTMLRGEDFHDALVNEAALPGTDPDQLAGPFAHIVVDEAQELTDAEWQMLLLRCPSRSFTIVGDRAQARHGFTESWQERLARVGLDRINLASLNINYRTPAEVMAEAEPVIRAVLPDANVPTSIRSGGVPVVHGSASDLSPNLNTWLAAHAEGIACVIGDPTFQATPRVRSLTPELSKGLEFDLVVLIDPEAFGTGIEGAVDRYVAMTRATQQLVILTSS